MGKMARKSVAGSIQPKALEEIQKLSVRDIKKTCLKESEKTWGRRGRGDKRWSRG